jgi:hypothetical protein
MKKLVFESLNEMNFQKKMDDPLVSLGVGQKHFILNWLDEMGVENYTINDDLTIDVNGDLRIGLYEDLDEIPEFIQFNKVYGNFYCNDNNLTSLRGCPTYVSGDFDCSSNDKIFTKAYIRNLCDVDGKIFTEKTYDMI